MEEDSKRYFSQHCHVAVVLWVICQDGRKHNYLSGFSGLTSWMEKTMLDKEESKSVWTYYFYFHVLAWNLVLCIDNSYLKNNNK